MTHVNITRNNHDEFIAAAGKPILLDFWAPWCSPCMQLAPIVEQIAGEHDNIIVGKVNVDEEMELAQQYRVMSIPTLLLLDGGKITGRAVGFRTKKEILKLISRK